MSETRLGEFEEVLLLLVGILGDEAYVFKIEEEYSTQTNRTSSIGAVHSTLIAWKIKDFWSLRWVRPRQEEEADENEST